MQLAVLCSNKLIITPVARSQVLVVQGSAVTWSTLLTASLRSLWPGTHPATGVPRDIVLEPMTR